MFSEKAGDWDWGQFVMGVIDGFFGVILMLFLIVGLSTQGW